MYQLSQSHFFRSLLAERLFQGYKSEAKQKFLYGCFWRKQLHKWLSGTGETEYDNQGRAFKNLQGWSNSYCFELRIWTRSWTANAPWEELQRNRLRSDTADDGITVLLFLVNFTTGSGYKAFTVSSEPWSGRTPGEHDGKKYTLDTEKHHRGVNGSGCATEPALKLTYTPTVTESQFMSIHLTHREFL